MFDRMYIMGMLFGILSGIAFSVGNILQKKAVNDLDAIDPAMPALDDKQEIDLVAPVQRDLPL